MSWILFHRRHTKQKLNLDCVKLNEIYEIDNDLKIKKHASGNEIVALLDKQTKCKTDMNLWNNHIKAIFAELKGFYPKEVLRGHFELEYFVCFIKQAKNAYEKAVKLPLKAHFEISEANALEILAPRIKIPKTLKSFLDIHIV